MPRPFKEPISGVAAPEARPAQQSTQVVAAPTNGLISPSESEFTQIAQALGSIHEPLRALHEQQDAEANRLAAREGAAAAVREQNPGIVADNPEPPPTSVVPPAYASTYAQAYRKGLGQRLGQQNHDDYLSEFSGQYQNEGFDKKSFDSQWRTRALSGVTDPVLTAEIGDSMDRAQTAASSEWTVLQQKRLGEQRGSMLASGMSAIDENTSPSQAMEAYQRLATDHVARGGTRSEAGQFLFDQMAGLSAKLGGRPDVFAVFDQEVPGLGKKLVDVMGPGMKDKVYSEMHTAEEMQKRTTNEHNQAQRGTDLDLIHKYTTDGTLAKMGEEERATWLKQYMGPTGALTPTSYAEVQMEVRKTLSAQQDLAHVIDTLDKGGGAILSPDVAKKGIDYSLSQPMGDAGLSVKQALFASIQDPQNNGKFFEPAVRAAINANVHGGVAFPDEMVKRLIDSTALAIPQPGSDTSPQFQGISRLYAKLEQESKPLLNAYFDDRSRQIFGSYNRATVEGQIDSRTAYSQAYASVDPDNVKAAEDRFRDPGMRTAVSDTVKGAMKGLFAPGNGAWSPRFWPGSDMLGMRPDTGAMEKSSYDEGINYKKLNPWVSDDGLMQHIKSWTEANFYYEPKSNQYVQIPPALNTPSTQEAVANYLSIISDQPGNKDMNPRLLYKGNGTYDLFFTPNGVPTKVSDNVRLESLVALQSAQKGFNDDERGALSALRSKVLDGTATQEDLAKNSLVVSKARSAGLWSDTVQQKADAIMVKRASAAVSTKLEPALFTAGHRGDFNPAAAIKPNGSLTTPIAQQFVQQGNLAGALATMGEGARTVAYKDAAGHNTIGIGYNLNANAGTINDDFRRAGIPVEQIEAIKAGKLQLTTDQVVRLYQAVQPRYEAVAQKGVEARYPGEWPKLGANVKAVLTDLAYQTGDVGQFKDGLDRLFKGDLSGTGLEAKYKSKATGTYTIDQRRHTLRTAMLSSLTLFNSLLTHAAKQPANAVQSAVARAGAAS